MSHGSCHIYSRKLTCPLKRDYDYFNRKCIFQPLIFRGHVSFQGCTVFLITAPHGAGKPPTQVAKYLRFGTSVAGGDSGAWESVHGNLRGPTWKIIPGWSKWLITMVIVSPLRIGLWDPFQMAVSWLIKGGDTNYLRCVGWSSKHPHNATLISRK